MSEEEAEEYYNKLWLENKELIQENIDRLNKKRFAQALMLAEKDKEIERLNNIINELETFIIENSFGSLLHNCSVIESYKVLDKLQELKGSGKE